VAVASGGGARPFFLALNYEEGREGLPVSCFGTTSTGRGGGRQKDITRRRRAFACPKKRERPTGGGREALPCDTRPSASWSGLVLFLLSLTLAMWCGAASRPERHCARVAATPPCKLRRASPSGRGAVLVPPIRTVTGVLIGRYYTREPCTVDRAWHTRPRWVRIHGKAEAYSICKG
jgi:hypothetical protein